MEETAVLFWLFFLLQVSLSGSSVVVGHGPVQVAAGHDVVLPCHLEPPFDVSDLAVEWKRNHVIVHVYRHRKDDDDFRGRTSLFPDELSRGNISLKLTNVSEEDSGLYICYVPRLNSRVKRGNVSLSVLSVYPQKNPAGREDKGGNDETKDDKKETEDDKEESRDQRGAITGIVVAVFVVILVSAVIAVYYSKRWGRERRKHRNYQQGEGAESAELDRLNPNPQNPQGPEPEQNPPKRSG